MNCPLCGSQETSLFERTPARLFFDCSSCGLVFVPRNELLSPEKEKARYDQHENKETGQYRAYLETISDQILPHLPFGSTGLDFGSGATTILGDLLSEKGFPTASFDLYYRAEPGLLERNYGFIVLSEVIEHLRTPAETLTKLSGLLVADGILVVKTKLLPERKNFSNWFYQRDPTHVQFFSLEVYEKFAGLFSLRYWKDFGKDLYLFRKHP